MELNSIERTIDIKAMLCMVWRVFINLHFEAREGDPHIDLKQGDPIRFRNANENYIAKGILLELSPERLIKYNLYKYNSNLITSIVTFEFEQMDNHIQLKGREEFVEVLNEEDLESARIGWGFAMAAFKIAIEQS